MLPPDRPSTIRAANSIARLCAIASITKLTAVPTRLRISTGRRPQRSDHAPSSGAATSWLDRERREQQPDHERRRAERCRVERQQRDDDPEADQVDEDREEEDEERTGQTVTIADVDASADPTVDSDSDRRRIVDWILSSEFELELTVTYLTVTS